MSVKTIGILSPGDMGHVVGKVLQSHGVHPLEGSCQEVKLRHAQLFVVFFCSCAQYDSHGLCQPLRAPVFGGCGVGAAPGPHQSPIRIKASGGGAVARTPCQPLAIAGPRKPSVPHRVHGG
jgi:hypothetical protein